MSDAKPATQTLGIYHRRLGDLVVTSLYDGYFDAHLGLVTGLPEAELAGLERAHHRAEPPRLTLNSFMIRGASDAPVLVDAGAGAAFGPTCGRLPENLQALGIEPAAVRTILLTHLHGDHVGGLVDGAGAAAFPNAELVLHPAELEFWTNEANAADAPEIVKDAIATALRSTAPYRDSGRVRSLAEGEAVPGVSIHPLPGHSPGHSGWMVRSGGESLLIWGDVVHMPGIQFANPEAGMIFDTDSAAAVATRRQAMETAAAERLLVAGMHLDFPAFGHLARDGAGFRWIPEMWNGGL